MRIGLIAALRPSRDGRLRAELPLAGRPVLAWQAALLRKIGVQRVLCLAEPGQARAAVLGVQHALENGGIPFHAIKGLAAIPALVRAEDDLIVIADGLVADEATARALLGEGDALRRVVATLPADHPLAAAHPEDFERIDAARCWAGVLAMRGKAAAQLAGMPPDGDAVSLLLRLALQAGTPTSGLGTATRVPEQWLLADSAVALAAAEADRIARAAPPRDWRAPAAGLAAVIVRRLVPRGLGKGERVAAVAALLLFGIALPLAALGLAGSALLLAAIGAFAAQIARGFAGLAARLEGETDAASGNGGGQGATAAAVDLAAAASLWFALAPWPQWQPLAVTGPIVIGLARAAERAGGKALAIPAADRASLLLLLALATSLGLLPEAVACLALGLLAALLLQAPRD